jgi:D-glycero-alpha-D-manno-heptose-7-phosphate kinase
LVVNATIDKYCYATIQERNDGEVHFIAADRGITQQLHDSITLLPLHTAIYRRLCNDYDLRSPSLTLTTIAEAPPGSGLGSSSTLVVSALEAFREYFALPLSKYDIATLSHSIERIDCNLTGGRQDQYAATFGGFNTMDFATSGAVIVNPLRLTPAVIHEFEASLVLFYTGIERSSAQIIDEQTTHITHNHLDRISATLRLKDEAAAMKEALLSGDFHKVAEVIRAGWEAKRQLADGITTPRIEQAFELALSHGALAGKVSGAGGGGYIMFVVEPHRRPALTAALSALDGRVEPAHFVQEGATAWRLT